MNVAIIGYGKMGRIIEEVLAQRNHNVVLKINSKNADELNEALLLKKQTDVAIEFSVPSAAYANILTCLAADIPVVIGTTGWQEKLASIESIANEQSKSVFFAQNFSLGMNIFFHVNKNLARILDKTNRYDAKLIEVHHLNKLDRPSGTAIKLADDIISELNSKQSWSLDTNIPNSEILFVDAKRKQHDYGTHTVCYCSDNDNIIFKHQSKSRKGYAEGAVVAAEWLIGRKGFFRMKDLLNLGE